MLLNPSVTCAGCKACYIDETKRHFTNGTEEHLGKNKKSHIYLYLYENPQCQEKVNFDCFENINHASSYFRLQIKEAMLINLKKPKLNKQVKHVLYLYRSIALLLFLFLFIFFYVFFLYPLALIKFYILIIYLLIFNCFLKCH